MKRKLVVEELEGRTVLSPTVSLTNGLLSVIADNNGDYVVVQNTGTNTLVLDGYNNTTTSFPTSQVNSLSFVGGAGIAGDYFANLTAIPSTQKAGANSGYNYLQGGTGNDTLLGSVNPLAKNYIVDSGAGGTVNTVVGGAGFNNIFMGAGNDNITTGPGYNAVYDILGVNVVNAQAGRGYLIVNAATTVSADSNYQVVTFFKAGISGNAPGSPNGPSAILSPDVNGNGILYLNQANNQANTFFQVDYNADHSQLVVTANGGRTFTFQTHSVSWIASFGPTGGNNTLINNTAVNDVFYGGLPSAMNPTPTHTIIGGFGINVLKGHSGTNTEISRGYYNDVTAGAGTDNVSVTRAITPAAADVVFNHLLGIVRANGKVSTIINDPSLADEISGVPLSFNGFGDPYDNDSGQPADVQDIVGFALLFRQRGLI